MRQPENLAFHRALPIRDNRVKRVRNSFTITPESMPPVAVPPLPTILEI